MKNRKEIERFKLLIEKDRINTKDDFSDLLVNDLTKLLSDYFEFKGLPNIYLEKKGEGIAISLSLYASRIKPFYALPQE